LAVRASNYAHAAVVDRTIGEGQPRRDILLAQFCPVSVLVPWDIARISRQLPKQAAAVDENVRSNDIFNGIQDTELRSQLHGPGMKEMQLSEALGVCLLSQRSLQGIQLITNLRRLLQAKNLHREHDPILLVLADLIV